MKLEYYRTPCGSHSTEISAEDFLQMERQIEHCPSTSHQPNFRQTHQYQQKHQYTSFLPSFPLKPSNLCCLLVVILLTTSCLLISIANAEDQSTIQYQQHLLRQFRHRLHSQQHRRHHYYSALLHSARRANSTTPSTSTTSTSTPSLSRLASPWSRHRSHHYYHHHNNRYYHYDHEEQNNKNKTNDETELISSSGTHPIPTFHWSSARSNSARLLREHSTTSTSASSIKIIYQSNEITSDDQLPFCEPLQVCNKVDTYSTPWIEKQCRCPVTSTGNYKPCSESLTANDGHTVMEKTKLYKMCEPVHSLPTCRYFRDITWTLTTTSAKKNLGGSLFNSLHNQHNQDSSENTTRQEMKCLCPPASVAYISRHHVHKEADGTLAYQYHFACSPETKLRCKRKEPCRLFTTRKRSKVEEVNTNTLCQCPGGYSCPANHRHPSVLTGGSGTVGASSASFLDNLRTYSAYCYPDSNLPSSDDTENNREHHHKTLTTETTSDEVTEGKLRSLPSAYKDSTTTANQQQQQQYHFSLLQR